jgi:protein-L-isoaspartate O-methyltransferase
MNSILQHGARAWNLIRSADIARLQYALWTRIHGLDLAAQGCEELRLPSARAKAHAASGGPLLNRVLNRLAIPPGKSVVDLGSGKGGAAITLSDHFAEVLGVELSPTLVEIARQNIRKLRITNARFVCDDAAQFADFKQFDYIYMFNPFPEVVMTQVLANVGRTFIQHGRPHTLIYKNPVSHQDLINAGWKKQDEFAFRDSQPFAVYRMCA